MLGHSNGTLFLFSWNYWCFSQYLLRYPTFGSRMLEMVAMVLKGTWRVCCLEQLVAEIYDCFDFDTHHLGRLTKLKQSRIVEYFITTFEHLDIRREGMSNSFFRECFISDLKDEMCAHVLMERPHTWLKDTQWAKEAQQLSPPRSANHPFLLSLNPSIHPLLKLPWRYTK